MVVNKNERVAEVWDHSVGNGGWKLNFLRAFNNWEMKLISNLLGALHYVRASSRLDRVVWKGVGGIDSQSEKLIGC